MSATILTLDTVDQAKAALAEAWPLIASECRQVLGGELHYQAMVYYALRMAGVPVTQIGMNVKQWIADPVSPLFQKLDLAKHELFRGGFEPIPDVVLFSPQVKADWRRRNWLETLRTMLVAIEIKASERAKARLRTGEITADIDKLAAHQAEVRFRGVDMAPVMMVIDTAPKPDERMPPVSVANCRAHAQALGVLWYYLSPDGEEHPA